MPPKLPKLIDLLPVPPNEGPPLPRGTGAKWPWYKNPGDPIWLTHEQKFKVEQVAGRYPTAWTEALVPPSVGVDRLEKFAERYGMDVFHRMSKRLPPVKKKEPKAAEEKESVVEELEEEVDKLEKKTAKEQKPKVEAPPHRERTKEQRISEVVREVKQEKIARGGLKPKEQIETVKQFAAEHGLGIIDNKLAADILKQSLVFTPQDEKKVLVWAMSSYRSRKAIPTTQMLSDYVEENIGTKATIENINMILQTVQSAVAEETVRKVKGI